MSLVDTNVLVHATVAASPDNDRAQTAIIRLTLTHPILISRQVMREYVAAVTRPQSWSAPMPMERALGNVAAFRRIFRVVEDKPEVWARFEELCASHDFAGKQVHDAYLVATMLAHGASRLLTFNTKHFRRFAPLIEVIEP